ncbi:MAG TPA: chorismate synthase [Thermoleophilia bacterium]|nr:chorismate synthase [Thermoleophilia bacterium]
MDRLRMLTAGESHGPQLTAILDGCPAGLAVSRADIDAQLARRQKGYGRGPRQAIEQDRVEIVGGVRHGLTMGTPIALVIRNRDAANWGDALTADASAADALEADALAADAASGPGAGKSQTMSGAPGGGVGAGEGADVGAGARPVTVPRPGHADLGGALLYDHTDIRDVIERASARETAARVACGAVARRLLAEVGCVVGSHVVAIGEVESGATLTAADLERTDDDPVRCLDAEAAARMRAAIDAAAAAGDTLGGVVEVVAFGFPPGVGSYVQGDRRLSARLAEAVFTVPAMKGVEVGMGFAAARLPGSRVHDAIAWDERRGYHRTSDRAGGVEGGISTGEPIVLRAAMKPIATLRNALQTVELGTHRATESRYERADVCAVPAAGIVLEAVVSLALADALLERFGGATVADVAAAVEAFKARCAGR